MRVLSATVLIALAALSCTSVLAQSPLPTLGDGSELTASAERRLGERIVRALYRDPEHIDDPVLADYVQGILQALLGAARARGTLSPEIDERFAWDILLSRDRTVNAFALPGGYLGVHLGLIGLTSTRDELASVLAHELSHVTQRHISRLITDQDRQTPLLLGAMLLGALAASKNPAATQALVVGGQALVLQNQLNFSRTMEREADRMGYGLMAPAGFAPQGFVGMFDKLQQANRLNDNGSWPYLRSHPLTTERIADMQARIPPGQATAQPPTLEHALIAARARVLASPGVDALRQWIAEPQATGFASQPVPRRAAALYAAALASNQLRDAAGARAAARALDDLLRDEPAARRLGRLLNAEIELAAGDGDAALAALPEGSARRPELLLRMQALLHAGRPGEGTAALQTWIVVHPGDASAWQLLASAWQALGQPLRAVRAEAEAHAARCDYGAALDRFRAGQDLARRSTAAADHIEASIIDTRLRAMESLLREQAAER
ncbi:peptidase M48 [Verminephrobacter aporrectodeae subsp. tuberculatae]|uniref:M48 family metalloprotease n=1 Tax=Verminephrobacter aporrectodeae TaxID=1110389 RepID=UPI0022439E83|nr:M48 family metalloprotease [Verminephrobacter aporrectodeae]MCW8166136.1 peptidase M48 [Verminephrobacter aporrectodeae subsp. tuberculatae]MCW8170423.1 peptidase M48 [Verminephrobacter aporrectodeae subsp. tuberculatae]MCW8207821.1 peptidase M48 [Verminephrobacter aporrectodeae subsp. tuberculatae]